MGKGPRVSRRTVVRVLMGTAAAGIVSGGGVLLHCARRQERAAALSNRLMLAFDEPDHAAAVGRRYLQRIGAVVDADRLARQIETETDIDPSTVSCRASAASALALQCRADFQAGHTVWVDGWLMARTEARVCALLALTGPTGIST